MENRIKNLEDQLSKAQESIANLYAIVNAMHVSNVKLQSPEYMDLFQKNRDRLENTSKSFLSNPETKPNYWPKVN